MSDDKIATTLLPETLAVSRLVPTNPSQTLRYRSERRFVPARSSLHVLHYAYHLILRSAAHTLNMYRSVPVLLRSKTSEWLTALHAVACADYML